MLDDNDPIREVLCVHLSLAGFDVEAIGDGRTGLDRTREVPFDLIVLDVMLPVLDGITVCRAIRMDRCNRYTPILMVTGRHTESDIVVGLESGADDYLVKPFGVRELLARVHAILRRAERGRQRSELSRHRRIEGRDLTIDAERRQTFVRGEAVGLTKQEFDVLYQLAIRPGVVFSRTALLQSVWRDDGEVTNRTVDTVISRLRRKIERNPQDPELLLTQWGVGYKFADAE
jgi:DNA-binding response OmpR family regulator